MIAPTNKESIVITLSSLVFITLFLPPPANVIAIYVLSLYSLYSIGSKRTFRYQHAFLILSLLFFISHLIHYAFDANLSTLTYELERKLPFLFFPFLWMNLAVKDVGKYTHQVLLTFSYGMNLFGIGLIALASFSFLETADLNVFYYHNLVAIVNGNAIYYSLLFIIALVILFENYRLKLHKITLIVIVFNTILMILLSSKLFVFMTILLHLYYFLLSPKNGFIIVTVSVIAIGSQFLINAENITKRYAGLNIENIFQFKQLDINPGTEFDGFSLRKELWSIGYELSTQNIKNFLLGVGPGDAQDQLNNRIKEKNMYIGVQGTSDTGYLNYNFHNQYVQTFVEVGAIGFLILLLFLIYLITLGVKNRNRLMLFVNLIFACSFLTESFLSRQIGIVSFVGFNSFFILVAEDETKEKLRLIFKRFFDIGFSLVIILTILSWLLPILLLCVFLETKSFPIFKQQRVGLNGTIFICFKLKTMRNNDSSDHLAAQINDERITVLGKHLRKYGLDELPQFFNVLLGDMSIVGPRPLMIYEEEQFSKIIPHFSSRLKIKPGITGLAQAHGYKGLVNDIFDIRLRYKLDLLYEKRYNVIVDIHIIFKTLIYLLKQK